MEGKKISFGFMKTKKLDKLPVQEKKDFIECVEEKAIKVVGGEDVQEIAPLVIPMKPNTLITTERLKQIAEKVESALDEPEKVEAPPKPLEIAPENETLDQMAVRELLEDSKKEVRVDTPQLTLLLPAKSVTSGEKESTIDDYESVPIQEFGLAMLRGMGWTKTNENSTFKPPQLRPKGLGLGADKVVKDKQKVTKNSKDEELTIIKNAYVKITNGKYNGYYGKVLSLDEDNGRVMVDITVKKETVSLSEFMMHPVTKSEFDKESKVINSNSFEQYKKNEGQKSSHNSEKESSRNTRDEKSKQERDGHDNNNLRRAQNDKQSEGKDEKERNLDRKQSEGRDGKERNLDKSNTRRDSSREKYSSKKNKRGSSQVSLSDSDSGTKRKSKRHYSSMESLDSDTEKNKRREKRYDSEQDRRREKERRRHDSSSDQDKSKKSYKESKKESVNDHKINKKDDDRRRHVSCKNDDKERRRHNSYSESEQRTSKKSDKERRRHDSDSESDHRSKRSDIEGKRDIDKKRKGKKKKRDRDRSPNYRKHRK